ncbi:DEAH-box ATP-dependent RNA helicase prp43 [Apiospora arundinis]
MATTATNNNKNMAFEAKLRASVPGPPGLPVIQVYEEFVRMLKANQAIIACSQTGSGKSTQIPRYVLNEQLGAGKMVTCTQPRRYVTITTAGFVAESMNVELGAEVNNLFCETLKLFTVLANTIKHIHKIGAKDDGILVILGPILSPDDVSLRLYTKEAFELCLPECKKTGIQSSEATSTLLALANHGFHNPINSGLIEPMDPEILLQGTELLLDLGLIQPDGSPSEDGKRANNVPVSPIWFNCLREAHRFGCVEDMLTIVAIENTDGSIQCLLSQR